MSRNENRFFSSEDDEYLVFVSMLVRTKSAAEQLAKQSGLRASMLKSIFQVEASGRELAMLQYGDQCLYDLSIWRITVINPDTKKLYVKRTESEQTKKIAKQLKATHKNAEELIHDELFRWYLSKISDVTGFLNVTRELFSIEEDEAITAYFSLPENSHKQSLRNELMEMVCNYDLSHKIEEFIKRMKEA